MSIGFGVCFSLLRPGILRGSDDSLAWLKLDELDLSPYDCVTFLERQFGVEISAFGTIWVTVDLKLRGGLVRRVVALVVEYLSVGLRLLLTAA